MELTFEQAMREGLQDNPEGAKLTIRILENHGDHLDFSLTNEAGDTFDFAVSGNDITSYEEA